MKTSFEVPRHTSNICKQESSSQLTQIDQALTTAANESLTSIDGKFVEVSGDISNSAQEVATALSAVGEAGTEDCERMNDEFGNAIDRAGDVVSIIQEMMPVLEEVEATLG